MGKQYFPGTETWYASDSPKSGFSAVFEDDKETAYFYAYDRAEAQNPILDALHIYNAESVGHQNEMSEVDIVWSLDGLKAVLLINGHPHALFDFALHCGYCRSEFLHVSKGWQHYPWNDAVMNQFSADSA